MIIDTNVYLSRWPFRRLAADEPAALVAALKRHGVTQAWAGSFDALLHRDIAAVNARLVEDCRRFGEGLLVPFGTVNPTLPDWEEDLRRCHEVHKMAGIRLHPNYNNYTLDDPAFARLLRLATERKLVVQLALKMEDERTQHPLMRVPTVDTKPLLKLLPQVPGLRLVILNALRNLRAELPAELAAAGAVWFEISMQEGIGGVGALLKRLPLERLLFGSYFPYFHWESALLKLREAGIEKEAGAILAENAKKVLAW